MKLFAVACVALAALSAATLGSFTPALAEATTDPLAGHRCLVTTSATIENTVASIAYADVVPGAWCEADVQRLKTDGTYVMWHDATLNRVASTESLAALGLSGSTAITSLTSAQFARITTKGGQPAATLDAFLAELAARDVPALIEIKSAMGSSANVTAMVDRARSLGAQVTWYGPLTSTCGLTPTLQRIKNAGGSVGFKMNLRCTGLLAASDLSQLVGTITQDPALLLANDGALARAYAEAGLYVVARQATATTWPVLAGYGVNRNLVNDVQAW